MDRMIEYCLHNANPSIVYRIRKDILQDISKEEENRLQEKIMSEKIIISILDCQKENGWLGNGFHGSNKNAGQFTNMEAGVKYLAEKGVKQDSDVLKRAMTAFKELPNTDACYRGMWNIDDEFKYAANGGNLFRCACIARAGWESFIDISPQIDLSLESFYRVLEVDSILDITRLVKKGTRRVFNDFEKEKMERHSYEEANHSFKGKLEHMNELVLEIVSGMDHVKKIYNLSKEDVEELNHIHDDLSSLNEDYVVLIEHTRNNTFPYSKLIREIEALVVRLANLEERLDNTLDTLGSMHDDEVRARQQLDEVKQILKR